MSLDLGSLDGVEPTARAALQKAQRYINQLEAKLVEMSATGKASGNLTPTQIAQIQKSLSATGSHPLNITGLTGQPTLNP